jgi:hypothetical protein
MDTKGNRLFLLLLLSLLTSLLFGVSFGDAWSNHATYLPPGLRLLDPSFLRNDWWLNHSTHYHWLFSHLVEALAAVHFLEWGLALVNTLLIAASVIGCWLIVRIFERGLALTATTFIAAMILLTSGMYSVAVTYLYTQALQPSTFAAVTTIFAMFRFIRRDFAATGILLAVGGAFHFNFLLLSLCLFPLAAVLFRINERRSLRLGLKGCARDLVPLLLPGLIVLGLNYEILHSLLASNATPGEVAAANRIFIDFAVPFHYKPTTFLYRFPVLLGWHLMGFAWVRLSREGGPADAALASLNAAFFILLWTATFLTTAVYVTPVARLFFWRLAPFSILIAVITMFVGVVRFARPDGPVFGTLPLRFLLFAAGLALIARDYLFYTYRYQLILAVPAAFFLLAVTSPAFGRNLRATLLKRVLPVAALAFFLVAAFVTAANDGYRYALLGEYLPWSGYHERYPDDVYRFAREHTPPDTRFIVPPDMYRFRLSAQRAIVVDSKAIPFGARMLIEWYHRLEDISGTTDPASIEAVDDGYAKMDCARLEFLRKKYNATYAVVGKDLASDCGPWTEVYRSGKVKILHWTGQ